MQYAARRAALADIRFIDRCEDFYQKVQANPNVKFIKCKVAKIVKDEKTGNPICHGVDTEGYHRYATEYDLVVLAVRMALIHRTRRQGF